MPLKKLLGNKVADICQTGKGNKAISSALGLQPLSTNWENNVKSCQEWPALQNYSKNTLTTHPMTIKQSSLAALLLCLKLKCDPKKKKNPIRNGALYIGKCLASMLQSGKTSTFYMRKSFLKEDWAIIR